MNAECITFPCECLCKVHYGKRYSHLDIHFMWYLFMQKNSYVWSSNSRKCRWTQCQRHYQQNEYLLFSSMLALSLWLDTHAHHKNHRKGSLCMYIEIFPNYHFIKLCVCVYINTLFATCCNIASKSKHKIVIQWALIEIIGSCYLTRCERLVKDMWWINLVCYVEMIRMRDCGQEFGWVNWII